MVGDSTYDTLDRHDLCGIRWPCWSPEGVRNTGGSLDVEYRIDTYSEDGQFGRWFGTV